MRRVPKGALRCFLRRKVPHPPYGHLLPAREEVEIQPGGGRKRRETAAAPGLLVSLPGKSAPACGEKDSAAQQQGGRAGRPVDP